MIEKKHIVYIVFLVLIIVSLGTSLSAISITSDGDGGATTEAELEAQLIDVNDVYTDNDFADNSADWNTAFGWGDHSIQNYFDIDIDFLTDIRDVDTAGIANDKILKYNSTSTNWEIGDDNSIHWLQNGFVDRSSSSISFTDGNRTFTIEPTASSFDYYIAGVKYTVDAYDGVVIDDTEGIWYFYYDDYTLTALHSPTHTQLEDLYLNKTTVGILYWDADNSKGQLLEERHGLSMSPYTHIYLHETVGTRYSYGLTLNSILADEDGDANTHAQFGTGIGEIFDEDLQHNINAVVNITGLQIWHRDTTLWTFTTNAGYSMLTTGSGRLAYDNVGTLTEVTNNDFVLCHVFAGSFAHGNPVVAIGQAEYTSKKLAQEAAVTEINNIVSIADVAPELKPIATVIFQTSNSYGNAIKARIVSTDEGDDYVDWTASDLSPGRAASDHGNLAGLGDDDHTQYSLVDGSRNFTGNVTAEWFVTAQSFFGDGGNLTNISGGVSDHGLLDGLGDDDHTQYILHTDLNSEAELEAQIADAADIYTDNDFADNSANWDNAYTWANSLYNTIGLKDLTAAEVNQLENIGASVISAAEWGYVATMQDVSTTADPTFDTPDFDDLVMANDNTNGQIATDTIDGFDDNRLSLGGGGSAGYARGGYMILYGNEYVGARGNVQIAAGQSLFTPPAILFYVAGNYVGGFSQATSYLGVGDAVPAYRVEAPNIFGAAGGMRASIFQPYSDIRCKEKLVDNLPRNMVSSFCENVSTGIWIYAFRDSFQDENGTVHIGDVNYSNLDFGIPAQMLFNWLNSTERFGQYAERLAHAVVHVPKDEALDFWAVNYNVVHLIFDRYTTFLNEDIQELREDLEEFKETATEEILENREHIVHMENWAEQFGYEPLPWD